MPGAGLWHTAVDVQQRQVLLRARADGGAEDPREEDSLMPA